jgi:hypothetical protein
MPGRYRLYNKGKPLKGASQGFEALLSGVIKDNVAAPYCIANEYIAGRIGAFLGLPVPPCGVFIDGATPKKLWFGSLDFNIDSHTLPPVDTAMCVRDMPSESTGLLLFDILIGNSDRHAENFEIDPPRMSVFDHSHCLFGTEPTKGEARLTAMKGRLAITGTPPTGGNRHCLLSVLDTGDHFGRWVERINALPDFFIEDVVREVRDVGAGITPAEATAAETFLKDRRDNVWEIVKANTDEFKAVMAWPLLPI